MPNALVTEYRACPLARSATNPPSTAVSGISRMTATRTLPMTPPKLLNMFSIDPKNPPIRPNHVGAPGNVGSEKPESEIRNLSHHPKICPNMMRRRRTTDIHTPAVAHPSFDSESSLSAIM
jgi:hypothetical protein